MSERQPAIVDSLARSKGPGPPPPRRWSEMEEEISDALDWLRRELRLIKENDKDLMRQFLDIGTRIRLLQWGGGDAALRRELAETVGGPEDEVRGSLADKLDLLQPDYSAPDAADCEVSSAAQPLASGYMSLPRKLKLRSCAASPPGASAAAARRGAGVGSPQLVRAALFPSIPEERG